MIHTGSLVSDAGRMIAKIEYDLNNKPVRIQFTNANVTKYVYSATGELLLVAGDTSSELLYVAAWNPVGNVNVVKWVEIANLTMYIVKKYK